MRQLSFIFAVMAMLLFAGNCWSRDAVSDQAAEHGTTTSAASADHGADAHASHGNTPAPPELPNIITAILNIRVGDHYVKDTDFGHTLHVYEKHILLVFITAFLSALIFGTVGLRALIPGKFQTFLEMVVEGIYGFLGAIMGEQGKKYIPFLGTLFIFIWVNNMCGLIPGLAPPTSKFQTTFTLAIIVFFYVNYVGIKEGGLGHYLWHLAGSPKGLVGWMLVPLMLPLEIIGTLAKPVSLSLRLFGNIMGEDVLIGVFMLMGIGLMSAFWTDPLVGLPLHLPFLFLALLTGTIQALVFTLLTTIYIMLLLPHEEHDHHHEESNSHPVHHPEVPGVPDDPTPHIGATSAPFTG